MSRAFRLVSRVSCLVSLLVSLPAAAQPKAGPPPVVAAPQAPTLTTPANLGVRRGTTTELTLAGANLDRLTGVWLSAPGVTAVVSDPAAFKVKVTAPADAPVGLYALRVATAAGGVSNARPVCVDEFREVDEADDIKAKDKAQPVPAACVVRGRAEAEASHYYRVPVKAGQRLTFEVLGRRLGSPVDPIVVLHDGKTKREMVDTYADDTPGLQGDARLTHTFPAAGDVIVEVRDTTYQGGTNYHYRLRIGDFPGVTTAFPLAVQRGTATPVGFSGPAADVPPVTVTVPDAPPAPVVYVSPRRASGAGGWPVSVRVSDHPETVEREPNNDAKSANALPVPGGVSARFGAANDVDTFRVAGKKGQKLAVHVAAFEVNAPTEVLFRVLDAKGAKLAESDPSKATARAEFTPPADGDYVIACEHLNYLHGPNEVYRLSVVPVVPDFTLTAAHDRADVPAGGATSTPPVTVNRLNGFAGPVALDVVGEGVVGGVTVPAGATTAHVPLLVDAAAKPGVRPFRVHGTATVGERKVVRLATAPDAVKAAFPGLANPPAEWGVSLAAGVVADPPFALTVPPDPPLAVAKGKGVTVPVAVSRAAGFDGDVTIAAAFTPPNVTVTPKPVKKGATSADTAVAVTAGAAAGPTQVVLRGTARVGGKDYVVVASPVALDVSDAEKAPGKK